MNKQQLKRLILKEVRAMYEAPKTSGISKQKAVNYIKRLTQGKQDWNPDLENQVEAFFAKHLGERGAWELMSAASNYYEAFGIDAEHHARAAGFESEREYIEYLKETIMQYLEMLKQR